MKIYIKYKYLALVIKLIITLQIIINSIYQCSGILCTPTLLPSNQYQLISSQCRNNVDNNMACYTPCTSNSHFVSTPLSYNYCNSPSYNSIYQYSYIVNNTCGGI